MNECNEMCSFCLSASFPLKNLFEKKEDRLSYFDKISSSLSQLKNILNENAEYSFQLCNKCSETIETVYCFHQTCLHNVGIYISYKKTIKIDLGIEKSNRSLESCNVNEIIDKKIVKSETCSSPKYSSGTEKPKEHISLGIESPNEEQNAHKKKLKTPQKHTEFPCPKCKKSFKKLSILNRHLVIHSGVKSYTCIMCNKTFFRKDNLDLHMRKAHQQSEIKKKRGRPVINEKLNKNEKNKLNCNFELCKKRFKYKTNLDIHLYDVHGVGDPIPNYKILKSCICETCGKTFNKKSNLDAHLLIHTGVRAYVCDICGKSFSQKFSLSVHMNIHTGNKPYKCTLCNKTFPQKANLRKHKLIHSGERPYSCEQCDLTFYSTSNLSRHKKTHSGEKTFECEVCGRTFADKSSYKRHNLIHTGEKPHSCDICSKAFIQKTSLVQHKQKYHSS